MQTHAVTADEQRGKEGQAVDVVPVAVGDEDVGLDRQPREQVLGEREQAGAAIEDDQRAVVGAYFDARRVATIPDSTRTRRRYRTAHPPKAEFHVRLPDRTDRYVSIS